MPLYLLNFFVKASGGSQCNNNDLVKLLRITREVMNKDAEGY